MTNLLTLPGITVFLDETAEMPRLVISAPRTMVLPKAFTSQCHKFAGEHGATIEFQAR